MVEQWTLPLGLWVTITVVIVVLVLRLFKSPISTASLFHVLAVLLMGVILLGPVSTAITHSAISRPKLSMIVDVSPSMSLTDGTDQSRYDTIRNVYLNEENIAQLTRTFDLSFQCFTEGLFQPSNQLKFDQPMTDGLSRLLASIMTLDQQLPQDQPLLVFSDGNDTDDAKYDTAYRNMLKQATRKMHAVAIGDAVIQPTLHGYAWASPSICQPGQTVTLHLQLQGISTLLSSRSPVITLIENGLVLATPIATQASSNMMHVTHPIKFNKPGIHQIYWQVSGQMGMPAKQYTTLVDIVDPPVNVLLLEGNPHWMSRNAARALQRDHRLNLTARYQLGDTRELQLSDNQQTTTDDALELDQREVIIMGSHAERLLNPAMRQHLYQWVSQGGGLLWLRGSDITPDTWPAALIPTQPISVTRRDALISDLALSFTFNGHAENLLRETALGQGRIMMLDESQLALTAVGDQAADLLMLRLVGAVAKPLVHGQGVLADMQLDHRDTRIGEDLSIEVTIRNTTQPQLQITLPDSTKQLITLTPDATNPLKWQARIPATQTGYHELNLLSHGNLKQAFTARPANDEMMHLTPNHDLLKQIANLTGGAYITTPQQMIDKLVTEQQHTLATQTSPIMRHRFNHPMLVLPILIFWLAGWYLHRRKGGV